MAAEMSREERRAAARQLGDQAMRTALAAARALDVFTAPPRPRPSSPAALHAVEDPGDDPDRSPA